MSSGDKVGVVFIVLVFLSFVIFKGDPDLQDALIKALMGGDK